MPLRSLEKRKSNLSYVKKKEEDFILKESILNDDEENLYPLVKPHNQIKLTESELQEDITRVLRATNPSAPSNIVRYSFKERQYKSVPYLEHAITHFSMDSNLISKDSLIVPGKHSGFWSYLKMRNNWNPFKPKFIKSFTYSSAWGTSIFEKFSNSTFLDNSTGIIKEDVETDSDVKNFEQGSLMTNETKVASHQDSNVNKTNKNNLNVSDKFQFCSRATQTISNPSQTKATQSEYPPRKTFSENLDLSVIYDSYVEDFRTHMQESKNKVTIFGENSKKPVTIEKRIQFPHELHFGDISHIFPVIKILERMVNLNTFDDIAQDFSYYEDPADVYRSDNHGTLLPLWKFSFEKTKKLPVTSIAWCKNYKDLFFVSHGKYDITLFEKRGVVCGYTLKNPGHPEYIIFTKSPVLCVDVNPRDNKLLCLGLLNGDVMVISIHKQSTNGNHIRNSSHVNSMKHRDSCWQVKWQSVENDSNLAFYSIGGDGRVCIWSINKYELNCQDLMILEQVDLPKDFCDLSSIYLESGMCLAVHPKKPHALLIGTQNGNIYYHLATNYNTKSSADIVMSFNKSTHRMIIYQLVWSLWHPDIFASCSADWTVAIWNCKQSNPLMVLDLGFVVSCIAWAPYSSTVLAAVTVDGKVRVYDFSIDRMEPLVCQTVGSNKLKAPLTSVVFNEKYPIILIGDARGNIYSMKLSPNLRKIPKINKREQFDMEEYQFNKLDQIVQLN